MDLIELGYLGVFIGTFLSANILPFPSDLIIVGAYEADLSIGPVLIIATAGSVLGGVVNYYIGYVGHSEKLIKRFKLNQEKLDRWEVRLSKWGILLGLISWVPGVGKPLTAALGFFRVRLLPLCFTMMIGKLFRFLIGTWIYLSVV